MSTEPVRAPPAALLRGRYATPIQDGSANRPRRVACALMPVLAHETWFVHGGGMDWSFAGEGLTLVYLLAAFAIAFGVRVLARRVPGVDVPFLARLAPWMPFAVRMHLAVSLIGLLSMGNYLSPALDLERDVVGVLLGAIMAVVAVSMATGYRTRPAAWLLVASGPI